MIEAILEAWRTNHRINARLIDAISDEGMRCTLSKRGGRSVVRQFAHLHNVRLAHLEARARPLAKGVRKFATADEPARGELGTVLDDSSARVATWFERVAAGEKGYRVFRRGLVQHLAYFIAHESHHRGNILLTLKQCGHAVDKDLRYGIWDWDRV